MCARVCDKCQVLIDFIRTFGYKEFKVVVCKWILCKIKRINFALYELVEAVKETGAEESMEMLKFLIERKRLKDISDLPLDLSV